MDQAGIYQELTQIFHDVFMRDDIALRPDLSAKEVEGWDSFKMIEIILSTEERFGCKIHSRELDRLQNVGDLVQLIERRGRPA
jgi:acyl carrier protein